MAELVVVHGDEGPVNAGERRVIDHFRSSLSDDFVLFPNLQMVHRHRVDDIDLLVLTPWGLIAVEVKDLAGEVLET